MKREMSKDHERFGFLRNLGTSLRIPTTTLPRIAIKNNSEAYLANSPKEFQAHYVVAENLKANALIESQRLQRNR
ncbi:MAG: hypothetical protein LUP94_01985 [Candidatus Methanomethylicus sp.]|nr:hypothetical protein [Candidatus Methanomethylicus sp.]